MGILERLQEDIGSLLERVEKPSRALVTAGMPYVNGPVHLGHLAGAHIPADIYTRWLKLLLGSPQVLYVCATDDHGSTSEVAALKKGISTRKLIDSIHRNQEATLKKYHISLDIYTGTSRPELFEDHKNYCRNFFKKLYQQKMLEKRVSSQWYDPEMKVFLPDRYVGGTCPRCGAKEAYSEECNSCGAQYEAHELANPQSAFSQARPILKESEHWYLNMWKVIDPLREQIELKRKSWRKGVLNEVQNYLYPCVIFSNKFEPLYRSLKDQLPSHKSRYAPGKKIIIQWGNQRELDKGCSVLKGAQVEFELVDTWAYRCISRDISWGVPILDDVDSSMAKKTLYVWPESLIAPISFTRLALAQKGLDPENYKEYWRDPRAKVYQFLGQDNIFFYVIMQGAMWLGTQSDPMRGPKSGELQFTEILSNYHLQIDGSKMSKSTGNFYTGDELLEKGYSADQIRYFLALLSLSEKNSNFDFDTFNERNKFLAGPLNACFEKPISAVHSQFGGKIPPGELMEKSALATGKMIKNYLRLMERAEFAKVLFQIENYARTINSLFAQFKPHDDRFDQKKREDALFSSFFILKNIMIMLSPFVPDTMERLRQSLRLPPEVFDLKELGKPIPAGHEVGDKSVYFPPVLDVK